MYQFRGFFTEWNPELGEAAARRWPGCTWRPIHEPFVGIGVRCPDVGTTNDGVSYNRLLELTYRIERELPEFAAEFGSSTIAFIEAECSGGRCTYAGWAMRAGRLELLIRMADAEPGRENLERLLAPLGATLAKGYFLPFVRGFWGEN